VSARPTGHGSDAGYQQHLKSGEVPCDPCRAAKAAYMAWYRFRVGVRHDPRRCAHCGSVFPGHACHALQLEMPGADR